MEPSGPSRKPRTPRARARSIFEQVSCSTPSDCTAIGIYSKKLGTFSTLAEAWNGTVWAIQPTPNPSGAADTFLNWGVVHLAPCLHGGRQLQRRQRRHDLRSHAGGALFVAEFQPAAGYREET